MTCCGRSMAEHGPDTLRCIKCACKRWQRGMDDNDFADRYICELKNDDPSSWPVIHTISEQSGGAFIARITGRDPTYRWARSFYRADLRLQPNGYVDMYLSLAKMGFGANPLAPGFFVDNQIMALDIRWGPREKKYDGVLGKCAYRAWYLVGVAPSRFEKIDELTLAAVVDGTYNKPRVTVVPGPPREPKSPFHAQRARISMDREELL